MPRLHPWQALPQGVQTGGFHAFKNLGPTDPREDVLSTTLPAKTSPELACPENSCFLVN